MKIESDPLGDSPVMTPPFFGFLKTLEANCVDLGPCQQNLASIPFPPILSKKTNLGLSTKKQNQHPDTPLKPELIGEFPRRDYNHQPHNPCWGQDTLKT